MKLNEEQQERFASTKPSPFFSSGLKFRNNVVNTNGKATIDKDKSSSVLQNESNQPFITNQNPTTNDVLSKLNGVDEDNNNNIKGSLISANHSSSNNGKDSHSHKKKKSLKDKHTSSDSNRSSNRHNASSHNSKKNKASFVNNKTFKEDENIKQHSKRHSHSNNSNSSLSSDSDKHNSKHESNKQEDNNNDNNNNKENEENNLESDLDNSLQDPELVNRRLHKREKICETDSEDEGSDDEKEVAWIIMPDKIYKIIWDLIIGVIILYSSIVTPYEIAFSDKTKDTWWDTMLDVFLWMDIVITFFSAYTDSEENVIKSHKKICINYLTSWFILDLISVLPINQLTSGSFTYNKITRISRLPKLYRLVKLTKLLRITKASKRNVNNVTKFFMEKLKINGNIKRLIVLILAFLLLNHLCACFWYFVAKLQDLSPDSWVVRLGYVDSSNFELYINSFYWTLTTITTVGYGDIHAGTNIERVYALFIMIIGGLLYSYSIGLLSSIVSTLDQKTAEMNQKLQILSSIKKEFNLDQNIYDQVRKVIKFDLSRNQKDKMMFLQELPNKLRIELSQIMHDKVIQNLYFFRDQPSDFFAYVAPLLKPIKFSQNDYLYKCQDMIDESK